MVEQIFVNLAVKDLGRTKAFFAKLGFTFNPQFTDENAACMIMGKNIFAMLLTHDTFKRFTKKEIIDSNNKIEAINALAVKSRKEVDEFVKKAVAAGGKIAREAEDHGWMYGQAIEDLDGHIWEFFYMDMNAAPKNQKVEMEMKNVNS